MNSTINSLAYNQSYNPNDGLLTFTSIYGDGTVATFGQVQTFIIKQIAQGIVFGTRCGAAALTLVLMWMISKSRKTPVFIINFVSLSLVIVHSALYISYILSGYASLAYTLTGFPQLVTTSDIHAYAACNIVQALLVTSIETSLFFQVRVIFEGNNSKKLAFMVTALTAALGLATIGMYFYSAISPIISIYENSADVSPIYFNAALILLASSINVATLLLVVKLAMAVKSRRFLGLKQFDNFHILLIISSQTLLVPSLLFILAYALPEDKGTEYLIPIATLMAVLSLPLSSMWATASSKEFKANSPSHFSPSSGSYTAGSISYCSDSVYSKSKRSIKQKLYDFCSRSRADSDKQSEKTYCDGRDLEKDSFPELSTPIGPSEYPFTKPPINDSTHRNEQLSWSNKSERFCGCNPTIKSVPSNNSEDLDLDLICVHDNKDEGFVETKKITLKR